MKFKPLRFPFNSSTTTLLEGAVVLNCSSMKTLAAPKGTYLSSSTSKLITEPRTSHRQNSRSSERKCCHRLDKLKFTRDLHPICRPLRQPACYPRSATGHLCASSPTSMPSGFRCSSCAMFVSCAPPAVRAVSRVLHRPLESADILPFSR